ncbi:MAG: energy-coupling factor ABC transporter permease [Acidobacteriota bacterium]
MHLPDGFLTAGVMVGTWTATGAGVAAALRAERRDDHHMPAGVLGAVAAFIFAAQLVNVPVAPGTSGHLVGAALAAVLLGPWRATIVMTVVLAVQALMFQDGGLGALGANTLDMGIAAVFAGWTTASLTARWLPTPRGAVAGGVLGGFTATLSSAALTSVWLGLSGLYPLGGIVRVMLFTHTFIGVLEALLTGAILTTVVRWRPDLVLGLQTRQQPAWGGALVLGSLSVAGIIAAFVAPFASGAPDGLEHAAERLGFGGRAAAWWTAPLPDYGLPFTMGPGLETALAGVAGTVMVAVVAWGVSRGVGTRRRDAVHR